MDLHLENATQRIFFFFCSWQIYCYMCLFFWQLGKHIDQDSSAATKKGKEGLNTRYKSGKTATDIVLKNVMDSYSIFFLSVVC